MLQTIMSYETPKVVTVHNPQIGLLRRVLQVLVILYVAVYQLWYAQEDIIATYRSIVQESLQLATP